ncbi:MAG: hypothetical protein EB060_01110 [Proteobacteria bacterium]|nr:hypothetical protein [Pseudomonadota bacterium]
MAFFDIFKNLTLGLAMFSGTAEDKKTEVDAGKGSEPDITLTAKVPAGPVMQDDVQSFLDQLTPEQIKALEAALTERFAPEKEKDEPEEELSLESKLQLFAAGAIDNAITNDGKIDDNEAKAIATAAGIKDPGPTALKVIKQVAQKIGETQHPELVLQGKTQEGRSPY